MFEWLKRLFGWRPEREQQIYRYWDGQRQRSIDPLEVLRSLHDHPTFKPEFHPQLILDADPASADVKEATAITLDAVNQAFGVEAYSDDGGKPSGLTIRKRLELLLEFSEYLDALKKNTGEMPTLQESMEPPPSDASTTSDISDCGSISIEPKPAEPAPC